MRKRLLITGGAGFIGSNLARYYLKAGYTVTVFDNLLRLGTKDNLSFLKQNFPQLKVIKEDIRDYQTVKNAVKAQEIIFHLSAQVAVTTSVVDPRSDFEINALGTFNLLEAVRQQKKKPIIIYTSTNKVYGGMEEVKIIEDKNGYKYQDLPYGVSEKMNLDFHSPYGCSKGCADQYVRDYSRIYGIPTVVFRQSCIYGPRQFGMEDQGWIAWFIIAATLSKPITIYGDGKQVRDVLYIDDLVRLFEMTLAKIKVAQGKIYNVGGGAKHTLSVWQQFGPMLEKLFRRKIKIRFADWRPGDQKIYVSDIRKVEKELGWKPKIGVEEGVTKLYHWIKQNKKMFKQLL